MTRNKGDTNFKKRSDFGKSRKIYAGKRVKKKVRRKGRLIPYEKVHRKGDPYKIQFWKREPMSEEGRKNWDKKLRPKLSPYVFHFGICAEVDESDLSSKEAIEDLCLEVEGREGDFYLMLRGHAKNEYHNSPYKVAHLRIERTSEGLRCKMIKNFRLWRFKFWKG